MYYFNYYLFFMIICFSCDKNMTAAREVDYAE